MICLLSALAAETKVFLPHMDIRSEETWGPFTWYRGILWGHEALVAVTGVGKIMAAAGCQAVVDRFKPEMILYTGAAGGIGDEISPGDLVVAKDCCQYDFDLRPFGQKLGKIPRIGVRFFPSHERLISSAMDFKPEGYRIFFGRILTGDVFLSPERLAIHGEAVKNLQGGAVDMEGAAAACVAFINHIPFLLVRYITDRVHDGLLGGFPRKLRLGSKRCLELITWIAGSAALTR